MAELRDMREKRGRKPKPAETESFYVTIPKNLHRYLLYLAQNSFIGASVGEVAAFMITRQSELMLRDKFHEIDIPSGDEN